MMDNTDFYFSHCKCCHVLHIMLKVTNEKQSLDTKMNYKLTNVIKPGVFMCQMSELRLTFVYYYNNCGCVVNTDRL